MVLTHLLTGVSQFLSVRIPLGFRLLVVSLTLLLSYRILSWLVLLRRFYLISSLEAGHRVSLPTPCEEVSDLISMAPGSQEATFLSEDEHEEGESSMARVSDKVLLAGQTKSITSTDVGSPRESEADDYSVSSKDQLRARVYSLLREVAHVPLSSPPRLKKTNSIFETSWGLVQDKPNTFGSFPESNHASSAIQFVNDCLSVKANDKSSQGSSFSGFGASSFPGNFKGKDFEIHHSSIGKRPQFVISLFHNFLGPNQLMGFAFLSPCGPNRRTCSVVLHMFWVLLSSFFQQWCFASGQGR